MTDPIQPKKLGIKETTELVDLACDAIKAFEEANKDGKLDKNDVLPALMKLWPNSIPAFTDIEQVPAELKDLDGAEATQLVAHVAERLTFDNARATAIVEKSLKCVSAAYQLFVAGKELQGAIALPSA